MIARDHERARLRELLQRARAGAGGALVVTGEAGVGKSTLLAFAAGVAAEFGFSVLKASGNESESELAFAGLHSLLAPITNRIERLAAPRASALRGALGLAPAETDERLAIYLATLDLLSSVAEERPLLVLADDLHWMDGASRDAILFVARRAPGVALAVFGGSRSEHIGLFEGASIPQLLVPGLPEGAGVQLSCAVRDDLAPMVARELWRATEGNPLALLEISALLSDAQALGREPLDHPLPTGPRLQRIFARRFADMPPPTQKSLLIAAASHTGSLAVVHRASRRFGIPQNALERAEADGLITVHDGVVTWRHPLLRSAVYGAASAPERRAAHRALAVSGGEERLGDHRAWHLAAAAAAPKESVAAELERLADKACARGALSTAIRALRQAAALTPDDDSRSQRLIAAAEVAAAIGSWDEAMTMLADAERRTGSALLHARATRVRARTEVLRGLPDTAHARLVQAAETIKHLDLELAASMMAEAVVAHMATGRWDAYRRTGERALELGRQVGGATEAIAGLVLAAHHLANGDTAEGLSLYSRYDEVAWNEGLWQAGPEIAGMYAFTLIWLERFDPAERVLRAMIDAARRAGTVRALAYPLAISAYLNFRRGHWAIAREQSAESVSLSRDLLGGAMLANNLGILAQIEAGLGDVQQARDHASESLARCQALSLGCVATYPHHALALLDLSTGDCEGAIRHIEAIDPEVSAGMVEPGLAQWLPIRIEACVRAGDLDAARAPLLELEHWSHRTGRTLGLAQAARCRGLMAPDSEFEQLFEQSLQWHSSPSQPFERARTQLGYGERLRRAHRRTAARRQLADALDTFESLGAKLWARRAQEELAAAGARPGGQSQSAPWEALTPSEQRVAQLIINGATYQEAADALFLSSRTIESHLRQMYRKLGVRSRTELTRRLGAAPSGEAVSA